MTQPWVPFGATPEDHAALHEGMPPWISISANAWIVTMIAPNGRVNLELVQGYDLQTRRTVPLMRQLASQTATTIVDRLPLDETFRILDYTINVNANAGNFLANEVLNGILEDGGSAWQVGTRNGRAGLERRVGEGVQGAAEEAMSTPGNAGILLSEAWHALFGVRPDYEIAYAKAVKAVEAACVPVVSPQNRAATLGSVVAQLRDQGDWGLAMSRSHSVHTTAAVVLGMVQALWTGHNDRHAGQPGYRPSTRSDAEAAVFLAVPLVQWFNSHAIARGN